MHKLLNFDTENFKFRVCSFNVEEQEFLNELKSDINTNKYVKEYYQYIKDTKESIENHKHIDRYTLIVYKKSNPIAIVNFFEVRDTLIYSVIVRPIMRGKNYSNRIKDELFDYVYKNSTDIRYIIGYIESSNVNSLKSVSKTNIDGIEKIYDPSENKTYYKITSENPLYNKRSR